MGVAIWDGAQNPIPFVFSLPRSGASVTSVSMQLSNHTKTEFKSQSGLERGLEVGQLELPGISPSENRLLARHEWSDACEFHSLNELQIFHQVGERVDRAGKPVVLLDLDSTLYQVEPRNFQILKEWCDSIESRSFPVERSQIAHLQLNQIGYSVKDTFQHLGIDVTRESGFQAYESVKEFWSSRFFRNEWLKWDRPYLGACEFVLDLHRRGAQIVYLTGRDEEGMRSGTESNLIRDRFPWGQPSIQLWMKPSRQLSDAVFKKAAAERLRSLGILVASFENEPHNLACLQSLYPEAMHVFMDSLCSDRPSVVCQGIYRIRSYEPVLIHQESFKNR